MPPRGLVVACVQHGWPGLQTGSRYQQDCTDCHQENARPVGSEPQESHAAPWRLQSVANRPGGIWATQRSPPNGSACHVQDSAENEQRAKHHQEHSRLSIHRCHAQQNLDSSARWCDSFRPRSAFAGFPSGRLTSSDQGTCVLSHHDPGAAPKRPHRPRRRRERCEKGKPRMAGSVAVSTSASSQRRPTEQN